MAGGIEERILDNIESATGTTFDEGGDEGPQQEPGQPNVPVDEQAQVSDQLSRRTRQQPAGDENLMQPTKPPAAKGKDQRKAPRRDAEGNIVDEQGNVLASRGIERRLHTQLERTREVNRSLEQRNQELARQLGERDFLGSAPQKLGLNNEELADAMQIAASFKASPAQAARAVIERALATGVSLHDIVDDQFIPNVSVAATQRLLDQRLGPLSRNLKEQESVERTTREATEKGNRFLAAYPDAIHQQDIVADQMAQVMQQYRQQGVELDPFVAAEKAFERVLVFCTKHGLDISQPLGPQVRARQASPGRGMTRARRPMPNGNGSGREVVSTSSRAAATDESYDSIVKEAMREEGYNL
jgi:hypothetical protein